MATLLKRLASRCAHAGHHNFNQCINPFRDLIFGECLACAILLCQETPESPTCQNRQMLMTPLMLKLPMMVLLLALFKLMDMLSSPGFWSGFRAWDRSEWLFVRR